MSEAPAEDLASHPGCASRTGDRRFGPLVTMPAYLPGSRITVVVGLKHPTRVSVA